MVATNFIPRREIISTKFFDDSETFRTEVNANFLLFLLPSSKLKDSYEDKNFHNKTNKKEIPFLNTHLGGEMFWCTFWMSAWFTAFNAYALSSDSNIINQRSWYLILFRDERDFFKLIILTFSADEKKNITTYEFVTFFISGNRIERHVFMV